MFLSAVRHTLNQAGMEARTLVKSGRLLRIDGWKMDSLTHCVQLINTPNGWQIVANRTQYFPLRDALLQDARNCGIKLDSIYHRQPA